MLFQYYFKITMRYITFFSLLFLLISLSAQTTSILFLGNSLTYSNDLPSTVERIAGTYDIEIDARSICLANYGLEDHINDGQFQKLLTQNKFDYVIFQQGPSSQAYGRESLIEFGGKIASVSRAHGAEPVYLMVWTSLNYYHTFDDVILNHINAAKINEARVLPVGKFWKMHYDKEKDDQLYSFDLFHPSAKGSFLAAVVIFHSLFPDENLERLLSISYADWDKRSLKKLIEMIMEEDK
ncbi:MAG: SGNH/GDSL hydrolase family protein [Cytophagales bacterium]|nr:SGNH/GDSL hydrolase family protein [Cytophagales bacterium]